VSRPKRAKVGRPPRKTAYERLHVILSEELLEYLKAAWRTHRRPDGSFASGPSQFVEDLIAQHRGRQSKKKRA